jgi:hypothetical protein
MSGGKKNARGGLEQAGEFVEKFRLVVLDDQEVIGPFVCDQVGGGGFLGVQGVGADQRAA